MQCILNHPYILTAFQTPTIHIYIHTSTHQSIHSQCHPHPSVYLPAHVYACLPACLSIYLCAGIVRAPTQHFDFWKPLFKMGTFALCSISSGSTLFADIKTISIYLVILARSNLIITSGTKVHHNLKISTYGPLKYIMDTPILKAFICMGASQRKGDCAKGAVVFTYFF